MSDSQTPAEPLTREAVIDALGGPILPLPEKPAPAEAATNGKIKKRLPAQPFPTGDPAAAAPPRVGGRPADIFNPIGRGPAPEPAPAETTPSGPETAP